MITDEEWKKAKDSKRAREALIQRETQQYLLDGNIITRKESNGDFTLLASIDGKTLHRVEDIEE
jgi:hypothetical protein